MDGVGGLYVHPRVVVTRTAFGENRILYNCADGGEPGTLTVAMGYHTRPVPVPAGGLDSLATA
jgi:hypothetical protein